MAFHHSFTAKIKNPWHENAQSREIWTMCVCVCKAQNMTEGILFRIKMNKLIKMLITKVNTKNNIK